MTSSLETPITSTPSSNTARTSAPAIIATLEHVNVTVKDPDATAELLCRIFDWKVRWSGGAKLGGRSVHVGASDNYLAIYAMRPDAPKASDPGLVIGGLNHIGIVVDDLDEVELRVKAEGLVPYAHANYEPGRRFYFDDADGIEFEVISY